MKALVTGGAGFIGSNLVKRLVAMNDVEDVVVADNLSLGNVDNIAGIKCMFYGRNYGDICDYEALSRIFNYHKDIDVVFHLAALPRVQFSIAEPLDTHNANINGTLNILLACREFGIKRFVYSSSSSIYGDQAADILSESTCAPNPMSPYALQKLNGEQYAKLFYDLYDVETISLRYFNVYGPGQDPTSNYACLIPKTINKLLDGEAPIIYGDGSHMRDYNYVTDVVDANVNAALTENVEAFGQSINIGSGKAYTVNDIVDKIAVLTDRKNIKNVHIAPVIEPVLTRADNNRAFILLGWEPKVDIIDGLNKSVQHFLERRTNGK